eukprot:s5048_g3.t1
MQRQDDAERDFDPVAELEELRLNADIEGTAWMEEKVKVMDREKVRKVAEATGERARSGRNWLPVGDLRMIDAASGDVDPAAKLEELRLSADIEGMAWVEKKVKELDQRVLRKVAQATGERVRSGHDWLPVEVLQKIVVMYCTPQAW